MRPIEQIQAINEQANGPGVWSQDQTPFDWSGTGEFDDLLYEADAQEHADAQAQALHDRHVGKDVSSPAVKKLNEQASDAIAEYTKKNNLLSDFMLKGF